MADELWCLSTGFFRYEDPRNDIDKDAGAKRQERERNPDQADDRGIGFIVFTDAGTDSPDHTTLFWAEQLFHVQECSPQVISLTQPARAGQRLNVSDGQDRSGDNTMTESGKTPRLATFGAGCFWGVEEAFRNVDGVLATAVGYMGGTRKNPTYEQVCSGETGHAEVVQVTYDPAKVSYDHLLEVFWSIHDPTQLNRQGPDTGPNYRSVIFYHDPEQGRIARRSKVDVETSGRFGFGKVVTLIQPANEFWMAEEYHQQYFAKHGGGRCHI